jgi:hypothetical protein
MAAAIYTVAARGHLTSLLCLIATLIAARAIAQAPFDQTYSAPAVTEAVLVCAPTAMGDIPCSP